MDITRRSRVGKPAASLKYIMAKEEMKSGLNITREQMIQLLNEDLAGEYQAIIAYTVYSQVLPRTQTLRGSWKRMPGKNWRMP
jgi:hypothetical protein